jgi:hypothetical protein
MVQITLYDVAGPGRSWTSLVTSSDANCPNKRGFKVRIDDVASSICQALSGGETRAVPGALERENIRGRRRGRKHDTTALRGALGCGWGLTRGALSYTLQLNLSPLSPLTD